jgi:RNA polymerase subunit RPABC4/transcription elongation factor Spt4
MSKKKECPSCAMMIDHHLDECPICEYEFAETKATTTKRTIIAVLLILLILFMFVKLI